MAGIKKLLYLFVPTHIVDFFLQQTMQYFDRQRVCQTEGNGLLQSRHIAMW